MASEKRPIIDDPWYGSSRVETDRNTEERYYAGKGALAKAFVLVVLTSLCLTGSVVIFAYSMIPK